MSRSGPMAQSRGRPASRRSCERAQGRARDAAKCRLPSAAWRSRQRAFASPSRITTRVTLWFPNARDAKPEMLEWKGSHLGVDLQPRRQIPRHRDAGADAARLAARRQQAHAHVRLCRQGPLDGLDGGRQMARHVGIGSAHPVAVQRQGRPDGQDSRSCSRVRKIAWPPSPVIRIRTLSLPASTTEWYFWCESAMAPRFWRGSPAAARWPRWRGMRRERCWPLELTGATPVF